MSNSNFPSLYYTKFAFCIIVSARAAVATAAAPLVSVHRLSLTEKDSPFVSMAVLYHKSRILSRGSLSAVVRGASPRRPAFVALLLVRAPVLSALSCLGVKLYPPRPPRGSANSRKAVCSRSALTKTEPPPMAALGVRTCSTLPLSALLRPLVFVAQKSAFVKASLRRFATLTKAPFCAVGVTLLREQKGEQKMYCSHWRVLKFIDILLAELRKEEPDWWRLRMMCYEFAEHVAIEREELRSHATIKNEWRPRR